MAKKTTKENNEAPAQTVASKAAAKVAANIFKRNPDIKEVHVASDGTAFYGRNDAQNHANSLKNREVFSYKRGTATITTPTPPPTPSDTSVSANDVDELTGESINNDTINTGE